ncbi:MAG TPA: MMPL family transporter [Thermoanaerobaculia bacterium]|nr:MMPL family transporter [Thermoanaerobaculia bacterium]
MIDTWLNRLAQASMTRPRRAIVAMTFATLVMAPGLARLQLRTDGHALMPIDDPEIRFDAQVRERFHLRDPIVVLVESSRPEGIYNPETLRRVRDLSAALARLPGVGADEVMSLATEHRDRVYPGTLNFRPYLDPLPDTAELIETLRGDVDAAAILKGTLVSADGKAASILVGAPNASAEEANADRTSLYRAILKTAKPFASAQDRIVVAGAPVAESLLGTHILQDLTLLVPLALIVIALACWWGCRRVWSLPVVLPKMGASLIWTFGLMGYLDVPVYLTTAVLPVVLITAFLADELHLVWHYQQILAQHPEAATDHMPALRQAVTEMSRPIVLVSLTTVAGFFSFSPSTIIPVQSFSLFSSLAVLFCLLWTFTVAPATLALIPGKRLERRGSSILDGHVLVRALSPLLSRRRATLAILGLLTLVLGFGLVRLRVQDSWIDGFAAGSPFRKDNDEVNTKLLGTHVLLAQVTVRPPSGRIPEGDERKGPLLDTATLKALGRFEDFLRTQPKVGGVLGPYSHLVTVSYLWQARREEFRRLPEGPSHIEHLIQLFDDARGPLRRRQVIDDSLSRTVVSIYLKEADYRGVAKLMHAIRGYERAHLAPLGMRIGFAGDVAVSQAMIPAIVRTQVYSLLLALVGCWLVIAILYRSAVTGLWAVVPACVAVLWVFGLMGWLGVPLGVATSMFCAITLGIGVDYAIHYVERYEVAQAAGHPRPDLKSLEETGPAIAIDSGAIALGFALLAISQVPANERLGLLVGIALVSSSLLTLVGLAALLPLVRRK